MTEGDRAKETVEQYLSRFTWARNPLTPEEQKGWVPLSGDKHPSRRRPGEEADETKDYAELINTNNSHSCKARRGRLAPCQRWNEKTGKWGGSRALEKQGGPVRAPHVRVPVEGEVRDQEQGRPGQARVRADGPEGRARAGGAPPPERHGHQQPSAGVFCPADNKLLTLFAAAGPVRV